MLLTQSDPFLQFLVLLSYLGLSLKFFQVGGQLSQNVFHAREVFARVAQTIFSFSAALFVFGNAGGLLQEQPQFLWFGFDDATDRALTDDGVCAGPKACAQKHVLHITAAYWLVVDVVTAVAIAREHTLDRDFFKLVPLTTCSVRLIVKHQFHTGTAGGFACVGAVENHILHGLAAQFTGTTFTQDPTHGINDVRFTTTIGAHHADQLAWQQKVGGVGKRFEARHLDGIETHLKPLVN